MLQYWTIAMVWITSQGKQATRSQQVCDLANFMHMHAMHPSDNIQTYYAISGRTLLHNTLHELLLLVNGLLEILLQSTLDLPDSRLPPDQELRLKEDLSCCMPAQTKHLRPEQRRTTKLKQRPRPHNKINCLMTASLQETYRHNLQ